MEQVGYRREEKMREAWDEKLGLGMDVDGYKASCVPFSEGDGGEVKLDCTPHMLLAVG